MKYVLLKLEDDAAEKFVRKAGKRALGVWDVPPPEEFCDCKNAKKAPTSQWGYDPQAGRRFHIPCNRFNKPLTTLGERLRMAFFGKNLIKDYR